MNPLLQKLDTAILGFIKKYNILFARIAIFIIYFWFGILKIFDTSPAQPLVKSLLEKTLPFISFRNFITAFALFEMAIGLLFLIKGAERLVMVLLAIHMATTFGPLIFLPQITWQYFLIPTLEGQYIIKNILIIALSFVIVSRIDFLPKEAKKENYV